MTSQPSFGKDEIKALRKRSGLTQRQFGARLKVDAITISRWERGSNRPGLRCIQRLGRFQRRLEELEEQVAS